MLCRSQAATTASRIFSCSATMMGRREAVSREGREEEEFDEAQALRAEPIRAARQALRVDKEGDAVGDPVADEEIGQRREGEVDDDFHHRVHLVLAADRTELEEGEAAMHREHEDRANQ